MTYEVVVTHSARQDIDGIVDWIVSNDNAANATHVLNQIYDRIEVLDDMPTRGSQPRELSALGITKYHEIYFKPYRIIYQVQTNQVIVHVVSDGRRDMRSLLERRLLS